MIHWPARVWTERPSSVMVTGSPVAEAAGRGGEVPTALSVTVGRGRIRTGTG
jgi:hypothetical protein